MGPESKDAVVRTLGHLIDELLQQRSVLKRIEDSLKEAAVERVVLKAQVATVQSNHDRLKNYLPQTDAE